MPGTKFSFPKIVAALLKPQKLQLFIFGLLITPVFLFICSALRFSYNYSIILLTIYSSGFIFFFVAWFIDTRYNLRLRKYVLTGIFLFTVYLFISFKYDFADPFYRCNDDFSDWIKEAPQAMNEFMVVKQEILANKEFCSEFSYNAGSGMFLRESDTSAYKDYEMPELLKWFQNGRGFIDFSETDTSFEYRECYGSVYTANGYVFYKNREHGYKSCVQIVDSMNLGNDWFAHVTKCKGCNE